jgi:two-component system chemotaxis response regulator CheB
VPSTPTDGHDIVVLGASAGGLDALKELLASLPAGLRASMFLVLHLSASWPSQIAEILSKSSSLPCRFGQDGDLIEHGTLLIAPPDRHLIVKREHVRLSPGPRENFWRPSIDVLFRSAAVAHGSRVVGVILSGTLDDGTAGLRAVRQCGGVAIVQDPEAAAFPEMPRSALDNVEGARALPLGEIGPEIVRLARVRPGPSPRMPSAFLREARVVEAVAAPTPPPPEPGALTTHTCPGCGGPLRQNPDNPDSFRCLVGHAYSIASLEEGTRREIESSLWTAIRLFQQRSNLDRTIAGEERHKGRPRAAETYLKRAAEMAGHAQWLQQLVLSLPEPALADDSDELRAESS